MALTRVSFVGGPAGPWQIDRIVAVIDRMEGARENIEKAGFTFEALFTTADLGVK